MYTRTLILVVFFYLLFSCNYINTIGANKDDIVIASVGDVYFYNSDLNIIYKQQKDLFSKQDSVVLVNNIIESWAKNQIIIQKAKLNLSKEKEDELNRLIEDYKNELYINTYKNALVAQNIDTLITSASIKQFYKANQNIFKLKEPIVKYKYISFNNKKHNINKVKSLFLKTNIQELDSIVYNDKQYEKQLNDSTWYAYKEIKESYFFLKNIKNENVLKKGFYKKYVKQKKIHLIKIIDIKYRGEIAPLERVIPVIKQMLLHKKKLDYTNNIDNKLIEEAIKNKTFKRY